ncbi:MAG TPA: hypothetical protein VHW71_08720 [Steroidobacteraceae bacterium]|nr:hypothetical protein [Steroidobacteraceae bacterium]
MTPGQFAECESHRISGRKLVIAVGGYKDRTRSLNTAANESQEVQRCCVGPMQILQDNQANPFGSPEILEKNPEQLIARFTIGPGSLRESGRLRGNLMHGSQCSRGGERIAGAPQCARVAPVLGDECLDQGALTEARSTGEQYQLAATRACLLDAAVQFFNLLFSLEKVHRRSLSDTAAAERHAIPQRLLIWGVGGRKMGDGPANLG